MDEIPRDFSLPHGKPFCHLDTRMLQDNMSDLLIHAHRAGDGVASHKGDARKLKQALNGTVFSVLAMQHWDNTVERDNFTAAFL